MTNSAKKIPAPVAVTMGCPAGIGPEIICRLLGQGDIPGAGRSIVVGDGAVLRQAADRLGLPLEGHPVASRPGNRQRYLTRRPSRCALVRSCPLGPARPRNWPCNGALYRGGGSTRQGRSL